MRLSERGFKIDTTGGGMFSTSLAVRVAGAMLVSLGFATTTALAAVADSTAYDDPVGDSAFVDISKVRVAHSNAVQVKVKSAVPLEVGQIYGFWIDVGRGGPRPDYYVAFAANADFRDPLIKVRSFRDRRGRSVRCSGFRARADVFSQKPVSVRIPRRCLGDPGRVRVAVEFDDPGHGTEDWSSDRRAFGPWVKR